MRVHIWRAYPDEWKAALYRWAEELLSVHPQVVGVILYGSLARGEATGWSDADVLILLSESEKPFRERIGDFLTAQLPLPLEPFPYTVAEALAMAEAGAGPPVSAGLEGEPLALRPEAVPIWQTLQALAKRWKAFPI